MFFNSESKGPVRPMHAYVQMIILTPKPNPTPDPNLYPEPNPTPEQVRPVQMIILAFISAGLCIGT